MRGADNREQIDLILQDLDDLEAQVRAGELSELKAAELADNYRREIEVLKEGMDPSEAPTEGAGTVAESDAISLPSRRVSGRVLVGSAIVGVAIIVIGWLAVTSLRDDAVSGAEGVVGDVIAGEGVDLEDVSNEQMEQVVAENPDVIGMRLALARRYFNEGDFARALDHYFEILDREQNPEALANVGWMTYLSGHADVALGYLEAALQRNPDYLPAKWFIANVLVTLEQPELAVPYLVEVISSEDAPDEINELAVELLSQIEGGS